jgi:hypothetical protein
MTTQQSIVIAVMWMVVAGLFALVLLLYRSVERAYRQSSRGQQGGLLPGAEAPPVEILTGDGIEFLPPLATDRPYFLGFVNGDCDDCARLLDALLDGAGHSTRAALVLVDGRAFERPIPVDAPVEVHPAAHPPDIQRGYGVSVLPLVYVMRNRTVLAVGSPAAPEQVHELLEDARRIEAELDAVREVSDQEHAPLRVVTRAEAEPAGRD